MREREREMGLLQLLPVQTRKHLTIFIFTLLWKNKSSLRLSLGFELFPAHRTRSKSRETTRPVRQRMQSEIFIFPPPWIQTLKPQVTTNSPDRLMAHRGGGETGAQWCSCNWLNL